MIEVLKQMKTDDTVTMAGKWKDTYDFECKWGPTCQQMIMKNKSGTMIAKWEQGWLIRPFTPRDKVAAKEIIEFISSSYSL